eukprot:CAMPEP_0178479110 /NCGR_PEP_ID=MMETSP0696-20121128/5009_1 /TAXON_ID=265572 /ORGANISM="Extubocellulus spinifer, Strain CCMP396" /LENGTH=36 /DNA_ID= /DNA_START= /DNA_END= /DNA_ORIENTATION=
MSTGGAGGARGNTCRLLCRISISINVIPPNSSIDIT